MQAGPAPVIAVVVRTAGGFLVGHSQHDLVLVKGPAKVLIDDVGRFGVEVWADEAIHPVTVRTLGAADVAVMGGHAACPRLSARIDTVAVRAARLLDHDRQAKGSGTAHLVISSGALAVRGCRAPVVPESTFMGGRLKLGERGIRDRGHRERLSDSFFVGALVFRALGNRDGPAQDFAAPHRAGACQAACSAAICSRTSLIAAFRASRF